MSSEKSRWTTSIPTVRRGVESAKQGSLQSHKQHEVAGARVVFRAGRAQALVSSLEFSATFEFCKSTPPRSVVLPTPPAVLKPAHAFGCRRSSLRVSVQKAERCRKNTHITSFLAYFASDVVPDLLRMAPDFYGRNHQDEGEHRQENIAWDNPQEQPAGQASQD
jgi:hypothetical protein